ncbi:MAG TPA: GIY-YIG nuclease family protein [Ignavibacteriaceae bacterium]|nr:GIY-YIG nuclease family protein [Ignavibacteriaceae bacterium]
MFFTYIIKSLKDSSYYYGSTSNLENRLKLHNGGKSKYTKSKRPWILHYKEEFETRTEAVKKEMFFKTLEGYIWLKDNEII